MLLFKDYVEHSEECNNSLYKVKMKLKAQLQLVLLKHYTVHTTFPSKVSLHELKQYGVQ